MVGHKCYMCDSSLPQVDNASISDLSAEESHGISQQKGERDSLPRGVPGTERREEGTRVNLNQRFGALDDNLKIDAEQLKRARDLHRQIGDYLIEAGIATGSRLQGSLARSTMEPPLHDIDKVIEINPSLADELAGQDGPERAMAIIRNADRPSARCLLRSQEARFGNNCTGGNVRFRLRPRLRHWRRRQVDLDRRYKGATVEALEHI